MLCCVMWHEWKMGIEHEKERRQGGTMGGGVGGTMQCTKKGIKGGRKSGKEEQTEDRPNEETERFGLRSSSERRDLCKRS